MDSNHLSKNKKEQEKEQISFLKKHWPHLLVGALSIGAYFLVTSSDDPVVSSSSPKTVAPPHTTGRAPNFM